MPLVSAESVPRPEAPAPIDVRAPEDIQRIPTEPSEFGALQGQSMSALGKAAQEAGAAGFDIASMRQRLHNEVVTDNQINNYNDQLTQKETAFYALHGQDAVNAFPAFRDDLINSRNEMRGQLQNQMQQLEFDRQTRRMQSLTLGRAGIHYDTQYDAFQKATNDAGYRLNRQGAAAAAADNDDDAFNNYVAGMMNSRLKEARQLGGGPEMVDNVLGQVRAEATEMRVQSMSVKNPQAAQAYLDANKDVIPSEKYKELSRGLKDQADQIAGQSDADGVARQNGLPGVPGAAARGGGGEVQGPAVIPYKAGDILTSTGMTQAQYDKYRQRLGDRESAGSGGYQAPNAAGYIGRYQMGSNERAAAAARLGIAVPTSEEFLKNPALQERLFEAYTDSNHAQMMKIPAYANASPQQKAALLAGAHLTGPDNMATYLSTGQQKADANGTTPSQYITMIARTMGVAPPLYGSTALKTPPVPVQTAAAAPTTATDAAAAPGVGAAPGAPLPQSTIDTLKEGGMSDEEIARVQSATTGTAAAPGAAPGTPAPGAAPTAPTPTPTTAAPTAAVAPPGMPRKSLEEMVSELPTVDAQGQPISETRQRAAINALTKAYNLHTAAMRGEVATVKQLQKDDLASIAQSGKPIPQLTDARIAAALGPEEAETYARDRDLAQNYYAETNDFDRLSTFDLNQRLERLRTAGEGQPGYAMKQQLYVKAQQEVTRIEHLRMTDPAAAVARFPEVIAASQGADLQNPATYQGVAQARMRAFQTLGIPSDAQVPVTNEEAAQMWRPIGEAARLGDAKTTRQELEKTIRYTQTGWGDQANAVLWKILQMGHADQATRDQALSALKRIGAAQQEQTRIQQQQNRAIDQAATAQAIGQAFAGVPPPPAPPSPSILPYSTSPEFAPGGPPPGPAAPRGRAYPAPDTEAIDMLRKQPALAAQFDATYGPGKAQQVLGIAPPPPGAGAAAAQPAAR